MGIRFQCDHCRKRLNVKSHQAGEQCICPACGGDIQIPVSADPITIRHGAEESKRAPKIQSKASSPQTIHAGKSTATREVSRSNLVAKPAVAPKRPSAVVRPQESFQLGKPRTKIESDPFRASTKHIWYLRHKHLGEKGPLQNEEVKDLLESNQLPVGYIVWREDWNDWIAIEKVFPGHFRSLEKVCDDGSQPEFSSGDRGTKVLNQRTLIFGVVGVVAFLIVAVLFYLWKFL